MIIFSANEESRIKEKLKAEKQDRLEYRRKRLAHFLAVENDQYEVSFFNLWNVSLFFFLLH